MTAAILYRGYIQTRGKAPIEKFKNVSSEKLRTESQAQVCVSYGGVLSENTVLVDINDKKQSDILLKIVRDYKVKCRVVKTSRGRHFLFKNSGDFKKCQGDVRLAIGLTADIKIGSKNSYEVLKIDGVQRPVEYDEMTVESDYDVIPKWLSPVRSDKHFLKMGNGSGRNSGLFGYKMTLHKKGFDADEISTTISIINNFIFKDPLPSAEMESILSDENFQDARPDFYVDGKFSHADFGDWMIRQYHMVRMYDQPHIFNGKIYRPEQRLIEREMIHELRIIKSAQRVEVYKYIDAVLDDIDPGPQRYFIAFKNGVLDLRTGELSPHSPEFIVTNLIPFNYDPGATSDILDTFLKNISCNDYQVMRLILEMIGYCLYGENNLRASFMLTGSEGSNGKSTLLDLLKYMLGGEFGGNLSTLDIKELGERFSTIMLYAKLANICDDVDETYLGGDKLAVFKRLVVGNSMKAEQKGQPVFNFKNRAKLIFSANAIPRMQTRGFEAIKSRLRIIRFDARFTPDDPDYDPNLGFKLQKPAVAEALIAYAVDALKEVLKTGRFTEPQKVIDALDDFEKDNNPILLFLDELIPENDIIGHPTKNIYTRYSVWCNEQGHNPLSFTAFSREIKRILKCEIKPKSIKDSMSGTYKSARCFVPGEGQK